MPDRHAWKTPCVATFASLMLAAVDASEYVHLNAESRERYDRGQAFLDKNKAKPGVITLPSGLQYRVLRDGDGDSHPADGATAAVHQEGRVLEDYLKDPEGLNAFESTRIAKGKLRTINDHKVNGSSLLVLDRVLPLMVEGDFWELYLSPAFYGKLTQYARWKGTYGHPPDKIYQYNKTTGEPLMEKGAHKFTAPPRAVKDGHLVVYRIEVTGITGKTIPRTDPQPYTSLTALDGYREWVAAEGGEGRTLVLALMRQPLKSKIYQSFCSTARKVSAAGRVSLGLSAASRYDAATKKFTTGEIETSLGLTAPGIFLSSDGAEWTKCPLPRNNDVGEGRRAMVECVQAQAGGGSAPPSARDEL